MQPEKTSLETVQQDLVDLVSRYGTLNAELPECGFSTPTKELDPRGFRFPRMTTENATPSAVLILFGALDDVPADYRSETVPSSLDVLLTQRAATLRKHPGQISFPGGQRDPADADDTACALREASEETGLDPSSVTVLGQLPTVGLPVTNFSVTPVIGWWSTPGSVDVVDDHEATRVFRVPVADLIDPDHRVSVLMTAPETGELLRPVMPGFLVADTLVWGFTALLIDRILDLLGWTHPWDRAQCVDVTGWDATQPAPKIFACHEHLSD
ncbi:CoA pyrophosphatase [Auritidibacter ignavus]|uniref:CoA pyrophosphatase n=1 Tax=Auritidibacter ignavus TaxID=678932 RepID=A0AAJ6ALF4_9MICC|nr:CoA pyrophosphatase [Auritidibacter ignavus]WGH93023.1 CoA pyrophosphatase [Auritidibacter ignavus]